MLWHGSEATCPAQIAASENGLEIIPEQGKLRMGVAGHGARFTNNAATAMRYKHTK